jgi:glycine reductase complex component B subunit alpha and beta
MGVSSTVADLEIGTFGIERIVEGTQTGRDGTTLTVNVPQLAVGAGEPALAEATVEVVRPGESVRITNVLDVVLPSVKAEEPGSTFPGVLGASGTSGRGRTNRLSGVAVLSACDWHAAGYVGPEEFPDSIIDMDGPGADRSPFGGTHNVVVRFVPASGAPLADVDAAVRRVTLTLARDLAATTIGQTPDSVASYPWPTGTEAREDLPRIAVILQIASEGPLVDTYLDGVPLAGLDPVPFDPRRVLDGSLTNGAYDWAAVRNVTAAYQDPAILRELFGRHGSDLAFAGLILALGYLDTPAQKLRSAEAAARVAKELDADGVICTTFSSGNSHTDTMLTIRACEALGIATTGLVCETNGGLTDHVAEADCLVSTGNEDELVPAWTPDRVSGNAEAARVGEPVPTWAYVGGCSQTGECDWTAVPA